jgi:WD40 repeat protein/serine/threonine protein kinase
MIDNDLSSADQLGQIADEFVEAFRQGKRPSVEEFARRYPGQANEIREMLPALVLMEKAKSADGSSGQRRQTRDPAAPPPLQQLGDYLILREVGRGGMGVVYEAQQLSLGRHVAIKVLPAHALLDARHLGRFRREARSAARLHHTNIVPVFGVGEQDGLHYYVMQFIHGLGLDVVLDELRRLRQPHGKQAPTMAEAPGRPAAGTRDVSVVDVARGLLSGVFRQPEQAETLAITPAKLVGGEDESGGMKEGAWDTSFVLHPSSSSSATIHLPGQSEGSALSESGSKYCHSVARVGMQVADALAHAASQGVLHRDIKPSNLLLDDTGNVWVADFGLAKAAGDSDDLTHTGDIVGTLRYMAPERFNGQGDLRSDVYSLGLTLYEMLALRPAFDEVDRNKLVKEVMHGEPVRPRKLNRTVPRDLETVVLKGIARDPAHRYQTPAEMADDLKRFLEDRPVRARRISGAERLWRWSRRNPAIAVLGGVLTVVLVLVTVASLLAAGHFNELRWNEARAAQNERKARAAESSQRHRAESEKQRADDKAQLARKAERAAKNLAQAEAKAKKLAQQETQRAEAEKKRAEEQLTRAEWLVYVGKLSLAQNDFEAGGGGFALQYLNECQWNLRGWEHRYLWSRINAKKTFLGHTGEVWCVAFSPDSKRIVFGSQDRTARVWDAETGRELLALRGHTNPVRSAVYSPDGKRIVTGAGDPGRPAEAKVWDAATGKELLSLKGLTGEVWSVAFSPDSKRIVTGAGNRGGGPGQAKVWDAGTGQELFDLKGHAARVSSVAFGPDGKRIVTGAGLVHIGTLAEVKVWDAATGRQLLDLKGHTAGVHGVAFSPDGKRIVTGAGNPGRGEAKVWDAGTGRELLALKGHTDWVSSVAFSPDGKRIVTGSADNTVRVWDGESGQEVFALKAHTTYITSVAFSPDGRRLVTGSEDKTVRVWDAERGQRILTLRARGGVRCVAFRPDGKRIVTCGDDCTTRVWNAATGQELLALQGWVYAVAFSPDGKRIVTGEGVANNGATVPAQAKVWDAGTGRQLLALKGHAGWVRGVAFRPDGKRIVTGSDDRTAKVWDAATGQEVLSLKGHTGGLASVGFSSDGKRIVTGGDATARVWNAATGQEILVLKGHAGGVGSAAFSPDGKRIVTGSLDKTAKVWDAETGQEVFALKGHKHWVHAVAFSPDGQRIVTSGEDKTVKVWDAQGGQELLTLKGHTSVVFSLAFSPDGKRLVTGSYDKTARVWVADRGQKVLTLMGHAAPVTCVAFSPDGKRLVSGSYDQTAKVWDAEKGKEVLALKGHTGWVWSVAFSSDGKRIFAWDAGKKALAWSAADGKPIDPVDPPPVPEPGPARSPDGFRHTIPRGNTIAVTDTSHLAKRFPAVLRGQDEPADNAERLAFAQLARDHKEFAFATRLWAEALASDPVLGDDRQAQHRYQAARAAVLAAAGQGKDRRPLDDEAKAKLRRQALDWLKAELTAWSKHIESGPPQNRLNISLQLSDWKQDNDLAGIRDAAALAKLPAEEKKAFLQLWTDVAELKKKAWVKSGAFLQEQLPRARQALPKDSPELAYLLAAIGMSFLEQKQWAKAEPFIRECLSIRQKTQPDSWVTFNAQSMLGGALLGQKKYAEAEPLLLEGYAGMKKRENTIPSVGKDRLSEAAERLVQLYDVTGKKDEAAKWRRELEAPQR